MPASKKLREAVAAKIAECANDARYGTFPEKRDDQCAAVHSVAVAVSEAFAKDNPRFDTLRFLAACHVL